MSMSYEIDRDDRISSLGDGFITFARKNNAPGATAADFIGRSIFGFIAGGETQHIYRLLNERVRLTGKAISFPFRCDAPCLRRRLMMSVTLRENGGLRFKTSTVALERRPCMPLLDPSAARTDEWLRICSWCKRIWANGQWREIEEGIEKLDLFEQPNLPNATHGVCGPCLVMLGVPALPSSPNLHPENP